MLTQNMEKDWMKSRGIKAQEWTEREKEWLGDRQEPDYPAACVRILKDKWDLNQEDCKCCCYHTRLTLFCPLSSDYKDAAEFEARVAVLLTGALYSTPCNACLDSADKISCRACRLKYARLEAEYEMDAER